MATEQELAKTSDRGLTRRVAGTVRTVFDDDAPGSERLRAGTVATVALAATGGGAWASAEAISHLAGANSGPLSAVASAVGSVATLGGEGVGVGAAVGLATYGLGFITTRTDRGDFRDERIGGHVWLGRVRTASLVAAGALGLVAAGTAGLDATGLAHLQSIDAGLVQAAVATAAGAGVMTAGRRITRIGLPQATRTPRALAE